MTEEGQHPQKHECDEYRNKEDSALFEASFKPAGGDLWIKNSVCYGREAALQKALRKLHEGCNDNVFNDT